jgi:hypothetical protein
LSVALVAAAVVGVGEDIVRTEAEIVVAIPVVFGIVVALVGLIVAASGIVGVVGTVVVSCVVGWELPVFEVVYVVVAFVAAVGIVVGAVVVGIDGASAAVIVFVEQSVVAASAFVDVGFVAGCNFVDAVHDFVVPPALQQQIELVDFAEQLVG